MDSIINWLWGLPGTVLYAVVAVLVFAEDALFVGFVVPGETAAVLGGVLAAQGRLSVSWLALVVTLAAIAGDSVGYFIGRRLGSGVLDGRVLRRRRDRVDRARALIRRWGPQAVFLARFAAFLRALMPTLAGISHMSFRRFFLFNVLGGVFWGVGYTLLGFFAGAAYKQVQSVVGGVVAAVLAAVVVTALVVWRVRRHRRGARERENPGP
ncbi:DedA family protein [Microbispora hainanensis]|uniref:DedA family protein n=1 Tax=Microbispora hainanensis TaxID=568844 RepID=A0A544YT95_9ACTN|nr:DedA family protein [Microbispora hainanensis]TQS19969.1 DedA family protein [Microbispora hainanensis]